MIKYLAIYRYKGKYSVKEMCEFFEVSRSGYYMRTKRKDKPDNDSYIVAYDTSAIQDKAREAVGNSTAVLVMIGVMLPAFFIAMYERDGQPAEKILRNIIRARFFYPAKRPYKTENFYNLIEQEVKFGIQNPKASPARTTPVGKRASSQVKQKRPTGNAKRQKAKKPAKTR